MRARKDHLAITKEGNGYEACPLLDFTALFLARRKIVEASTGRLNEQAFVDVALASS